MRQHRRTLAVLAAALVMSLTLTACNTLNTRLSDLVRDKFDAAAYMRGQMDGFYLGKFDPTYLETVGSTEQEAWVSYDEVINMRVGTFIHVFSVDYPTDDFKARIAGLYKDLYAFSDYTVVSSAQQDDGSFSVKLSVRPLDTIQLMYDAYPAFQKEFEARYADVDTDAMSDTEYQEWYEKVYDLDYQNALADLLAQIVPKTGTLDEQTIAVQIEKDADGYYAISDESFSSLDALIVDYD